MKENPRIASGGSGISKEGSRERAARDCTLKITNCELRIDEGRDSKGCIPFRLPAFADSPSRDLRPRLPSVFRLPPSASLVLLAVGLLGLSGASCPRMFTRETPPPRVLPPGATLEQVIQAVHQHSAQIQSYVAQSAWLSGPGWPTLHASIAFQRPLFFRLRAGMGLTGAEMDLGSNDQVLWYWVRRDQPPAVYFCRHDQFATSRARQHAHRPLLADRCLGRCRFRPFAAAPGALSGSERPAGDPHHSRDARGAGHKNHPHRRRDCLGDGAVRLRRQRTLAG